MSPSDPRTGSKLWEVARDAVDDRDSVYFSVLDSEWPAVKAGLERRLG